MNPARYSMLVSFEHLQTIKVSKKFTIVLTVFIHFKTFGISVALKKKTKLKINVSKIPLLQGCKDCRK